MEKIEKAFGDCTLVYLEKTFGITQINHVEGLSDWLFLSKKMNISDFEKEELLLCQELLQDNIIHWNEQELSLHFIGPILSLTRFTSPERRFNIFAERFIEASIDNIHGELIRLFGKPDGLIASGYREPEAPFFAFQEYKKHKEPNGEPEGQCLAALLAGQSINSIQHQTMYGCVVTGQNWYFLALIDKKYYISPAYSALTDDIFEIFKILKALKEIVKELTA